MKTLLEEQYGLEEQHEGQKAYDFDEEMEGIKTGRIVSGQRASTSLYDFTELNEELKKTESYAVDDAETVSDQAYDFDALMANVETGNKLPDEIPSMVKYLESQ